MLKVYWTELLPEIIAYLENEEWILVPSDKKQKIWMDLRNPENLETYIKYSPGCDMINFKIYRPDGLTKMSKFTTWVFIPGISAKLSTLQSSVGRKSE